MSTVGRHRIVLIDGIMPGIAAVASFLRDAGMKVLTVEDTPFPNLPAHKKHAITFTDTADHVRHQGTRECMRRLRRLKR